MAKGTNPRMCFGMGEQEEVTQTQRVSQSHTSQGLSPTPATAVHKALALAGVFWVVANEGIDVKDIKCNRMFPRKG